MTEQIKGWDNEKRPVKAGYSSDAVQAWCVRSRVWQEFRLSLKGLPTHEKLAKLVKWWDNHMLGATGMEGAMVEVQVGNYLGALRRGGQLDANNQIRKYI